MPTGYTAPIYEGKDITFKEFALQCARNFGALLEMRDKPKDAPIPDNLGEDSINRCRERLEFSKRRLAEYKFTPMSAEEQDTAYAQYCEKRETEQAKQIAAKERYKAMIAKVESWNPPTDEHVNLKNFMLEQLKDSIDFDCRDVLIVSKEDWLKIFDCDETPYLKKSVALDEEYLERTINSVNSRREWIKQLKDSLE